MAAPAPAPETYTYEIPLGGTHGNVQAIVTTSWRVAAQFFNDLLHDNDGGFRAVGFDTETSQRKLDSTELAAGAVAVYHGPSVVQISDPTGKQVLVLLLEKMYKCFGVLPRHLDSLLMSKRTVKVGVGALRDALALMDGYYGGRLALGGIALGGIVELECVCGLQERDTQCWSGIVELECVCGLQERDTQCWSLVDLAKRYLSGGVVNLGLGAPFDNWCRAHEHKSSLYAPWDGDTPLSYEHVEYAALDAVFSLLVYERCIRRREQPVLPARADLRVSVTADEGAVLRFLLAKQRELGPNMPRDQSKLTALLVNSCSAIARHPQPRDAAAEQLNALRAHGMMKVNVAGEWTIASHAQES